MPEEGASRVFQQFQDDLAPKLDTYEQAIYLYIFRHTRFLGKEEAVIGFKAARVRMATAQLAHCRSLLLQPLAFDGRGAPRKTLRSSRFKSREETERRVVKERSRTRL